MFVPMRVSISVTDYSRPGVLDRAARAADEGGLDTLWVQDHLRQGAPGSDPNSQMFEAYTALGYAAAITQRVRLGTLVTAATFRAPALLALAVATLNTLSGERAWLGIGAGYDEDEARAFGMDLPPMKERYAALETVLEAVHDVPVLIGGTGEKRTLRLVASHADACNLFDIPDGGAAVRHKLEVLKRHCDDLNRDYDAIEKTIGTRLGPDESNEAWAERLSGLGIDHAIVITSGPWDEAQLERVTTAARVAASA
jgi:alkanesulfonate monooxygenase SsuD/methylene tetrahydromethanopterin reductase-like flavin-dependent oxidoreductase (luciferase family)